MWKFTESEYQAALEALAVRGVEHRLELSADQAFMLFAQLQLVLRHPENKGPSAEFARLLARGLEEHLSTAGGPVIAELCRRGWEKRAGWAH